MPPIKVMTLLLTAVTPFVIVSGVARAEERILLAQAQTPQQQEEERKRKEREKAQEQQKQQQQKAQEQQKAQQLKAQEQQKTQQKGQEPKPQDLRHTQEQHPQPPAKPGESPVGPGHTPGQNQANVPQHGQPQAPATTPVHTDQAKGQQLPKPGSPQQVAARSPLPPHRELSPAAQQAKAQRDAHRTTREAIIVKQRQQAANEKTPAALNERIKIQTERFHAISGQRTQTTDKHGQTVITEPGNRTIIQVNNKIFIQHNETVTFNSYGGNVQTTRSPSGNTLATIVRPGGVRLEIEVDTYGRPLRRVRILPDGRRFVLFENRLIEAGVGFALASFIVDLGPPRIDFPREQYIVDADLASEDDIYVALQAGPVAPLDRGYSLDEILASVSLRERMRSISLDSINFDFGSWEVGPDQAQMLEVVAAVIRDMIDQSPGEVFLIEGHTDAVGSDLDNLSLSDRRAQAVADLLSQQFSIPRENLVTQGYGKQFLLIPTDAPERRNRRVVVRRITPLLGGDGDRYSSGYGPQDR